MKLNEIVHNPNDESRFRELGMFIAYSLDGRSTEAIQYFCDDYDIPNCVDEDEMHVPVIYSKTFDERFTPEGVLKEPISVHGFDLEIWKTQDRTKALVARFESQHLQELVDDYQSQYDFDNVYDEFIPHFIISHDIEDAQLNDMKRLSLEFNEYVPFVHLVEEYAEPMNQEWLKKLKRKKNGGNKK